MRITLTKRESTRAIGVELLELCSTITEDGTVTDEEIAGLRAWLKGHADADLPAITMLTCVVEQIIADGKITPDERSEIHRLLERVLPKELRETAQVQRRRREAEDLIEARKRAAEAEQERKKYAPAASFDFMVAGVFYEGRDRLVRAIARTDGAVFLLRDSKNQFSRNAVKVILGNGACIGFVPEEDAVAMAPLLDSGHKQRASIKKMWEGGRGLIPVVVAELYPPDTLATQPIMVTPEMVPPAPANAVQSLGQLGRGCGLTCAVIVGLVIALFVVMTLRGQ
jgi:hypothetical protein